VASVAAVAAMVYATASDVPTCFATAAQRPMMQTDRNASVIYALSSRFELLPKLIVKFPIKLFRKP